MTRILMVCTGNICRSPMAALVGRHQSALSGLGKRFEFDSAGTHAQAHAGARPDARAQQVLARRGYPEMTGRARSIDSKDFDRFDFVIAMDQKNLAALKRYVLPGQAHKLHLLLDFANGVEDNEIPDPYYSQIDAFERVLDLCEAGTQGLLQQLSKLPYTP